MGCPSCCRSHQTRPDGGERNPRATQARDRRLASEWRWATAVARRVLLSRTDTGGGEARSKKRGPSYQVFTCGAGSGRRTRTRASTATQPSGPAITGLRSSSATSGRSSPSRDNRWMRSASAAVIGRRGPAVARDELPGLALAEELVCVDVGQRCDAESGLADQLGKDAARAEGDERAERRVLDDAGEKLDAALRPSAGR